MACFGLYVARGLLRVRHAADRSVVLDEGRVIEAGTPPQVLECPQTERTRRFLSKMMLN